MNRRERRAWIRSPRGQMTLLGWVFLGSVLFSIGCIFARGVFFERYVYEKFEPLEARLENLSEAQLGTLDADDRRLLYGALITSGDGAPTAYFVQRPAELHGWLRGTVVTGDPTQRRRATTLLTELYGHGIDDDVHQTATYALARAERLDDAAWADDARAALDAAP